MVLPKVKRPSNRTTLTQDVSLQETAKPMKDFNEPSDTEILKFNHNNKEAELKASQSTSDDALEQLMVNMVADQRKYLAARKQDITEDYIEQRAVVLDDIHMAFGDYEKEASAAHQAQLRGLQDLLAQKANIEAAMTKQLASLQKTYDAHSRDLETVITRQLQDMK
ncbi:hypothetical protein COCSADRAFT_183043 [Bipolaris sorokiniana ND90Pr]|uniref:Uncharacterized protein n=1 Tax=Cochliobolus sativus (strain ND90Pr / ATCC 201652) TaxID=665912 RepID=M2SY57_COCSN|nr:uncharacterized protein COCSADRAFT_183043 [Bipolaris sorokiniana ND90Pr]EMD61881.1 hypothetical protein COCSADRAFT_183043 [Bipolaris sorokiniana ND90Pr]